VKIGVESETFTEVKIGVDSGTLIEDAVVWEQGMPPFGGARNGARSILRRARQILKGLLSYSECVYCSNVIFSFSIVEADACSSCGWIAIF
jgi:hypothetical protein